MNIFNISKFFRIGSLGGLLVAATLLSGCGGGDRNPNSPVKISEGPVVKDGKIDSRLVGAWRVLGVGQLIEIGENTVQFFEETKTLCYPAGEANDVSSVSAFTFRGTTDLQNYVVEIFQAPNKLSEYSYERIDRIPASCRLSPAKDPATTFKAMREVIDLDYAFLKERNIDWAARYERLAPKAAAAKTDDALQAVLIEALQDFNDEHTALTRETNSQLDFVFIASNTPTFKMLKQAFAVQTEITDFQAFEALWKAKVRENFASALTEGSKGRVLNDAVVWGKLPGNVGYIEIASMFAYAGQPDVTRDLAAIGAELDRALTALAGTKALIVDVALNIGGSDLVSSEIASRFADQRRLAFTKRSYRDHPKRPTQSWYVDPSTRVRYQKPVYLLTSDRTVSAGDTFTLMMREFPNVTHVGQRTSGSLSNSLRKTLPGSFGVFISNEIYLDPRGELFEARGIPPKLPITVFDPANPESLFTGHAQAIAAIVKQIQ